MNRSVKQSNTIKLCTAPGQEPVTIYVTYGAIHKTYVYDIHLSKSGVNSIRCRLITESPSPEALHISSENPSESLELYTFSLPKDQNRQSGRLSWLDREVLKNSQCPTVVRDLCAYLSGSPVDLSVHVPHDPSFWENRTPFEQAVYEACMRVPFGAVVTYGMLAKDAGYPKAARAVGSCLGKNDHILLVPCHRVVPSAVYAQIAGNEGHFFDQESAYVGGFRYGTELKYLLLKQEYLSASLRDRAR